MIKKYIEMVVEEMLCGITGYQCFENQRKWFAPASELTGLKDTVTRQKTLIERLTNRLDTLERYLDIKYVPNCQPDFKYIKTKDK